MGRMGTSEEIAKAALFLASDDSNFVTGIERFVDGEESQAEIVAAGFDEATVRRVARLVLGSEYKRRQAAPGPKITTRAFGRNRRYPISSGWR